MVSQSGIYEQDSGLAAAAAPGERAEEEAYEGRVLAGKVGREVGKVG